jgi:hypothetical protein
VPVLEKDVDGPSSLPLRLDGEVPNHLYPKIKITMEMAQERPDLKAMVGYELTVVRAKRLANGRIGFYWELTATRASPCSRSPPYTASAVGTRARVRFRRQSLSRGKVVSTDPP